MQVLSRLTYFWPGLTRLWWRGDLSGLAIAFAFAALLNLLLLDSFWWPDLLPTAWSSVGWGLCLASWCGGFWIAGRHGGGVIARSPSTEEQDLLNRAQAEYLRGRWSEAQAILEQQIRQDPKDIESTLLLSSVFRRSGRIELSRRRLEMAARLEDADRWRLEIERERAILNQARAAVDETAVAGT